MVCARVVSLASWSWLWSLLVSEEAAVTPSLCLSFPILLVSGSMVLQEVEVSQIINVLSYLYVLSSILQVDLYAVRSRSAFQVPFQVHKK